MNATDSPIRLPVRLAALGFFLLPACQQQMANQPSLRPDEPSSFYLDGRAQRPALPNTVARGHLRTDVRLFTGKHPGQNRPWSVGALTVGLAAQGPWAALEALNLDVENDVEEFPFPINAEVLRH